MSKRKQYLYSPGFIDAASPIVIKGEAIKRGAIVTVSRKLRPPMFPACFAVITDKQGNVQHVFRRALIEVTK